MHHSKFCSRQDPQEHEQKILAGSSGVLSFRLLEGGWAGTRENRRGTALILARHDRS